MLALVTRPLLAMPWLHGLETLTQGSRWCQGYTAQYGSVVSNPFACEPCEDSKMSVTPCLLPAETHTSFLSCSAFPLTLSFSSCKIRGTCFSLGFSLLFCEARQMASVSFQVSIWYYWSTLWSFFFFLLPSLCQPGPFGSQTENSTQNGLGKMRMHCSSTTYLHQKKKNAEANLVMGIFLRTGFLSGTWLFPWCWVHLQTLLVIPSPGGKMATLLVHIIPTPNPAVQKVLNMFLNNILGPGSPRPKFGQYSSLKHCRQRPARFGSLGWGHVHPQSWR